ncbi:MAG: trehalase-like domain-containing protein, partial [Rhodomicrobium sp.]
MWPRFDSGALFAALLGSPSNGRWTINTEDAPAKICRKYRENTLVLETEFETEDGIAAVIDFMPVGTEGKSHVVRLVEGRRGTLGMATEFVLRFDYGLIVPWVTRIDGEGLKAIAGP